MRFLPALAILLGGCATHPPPAVSSPPQSLVVTSGGVNTSAIYLVRTGAGVIVIDLGWWGAGEALAGGLTRLGAVADDVAAVFLTHSHRDHMAAWRIVRRAPFYVAEQEIDLLFGRRQHRGWIPKWTDMISRSDLPAPDDVTVRPFAADTFFTFGSDTVRAFLVPGHTAGSAAYLFRGTLFAGDAISKTWTGGFVPARGGYSDDTKAARHSLVSLRSRLEHYTVRWMCTAHLECTPVTDGFWSDLLGAHD